jgi:hypothetical protein
MIGGLWLRQNPNRHKVGPISELIRGSSLVKEMQLKRGGMVPKTSSFIFFNKLGKAKDFLRIDNPRIAIA